MSAITKLLKDLLERVESGEVVVTNFDLTNDDEDGVLTGEQYVTITMWPAHGKRLKKPAHTTEQLFGPPEIWYSGDMMGVSKTVIESEINKSLDLQATKLLTDLREARISPRTFRGAAKPLAIRIQSALSHLEPGTTDYARMSDALARLTCRSYAWLMGDVVDTKTEDKDNA